MTDSSTGWTVYDPDTSNSSTDMWNGIFYYIPSVEYEYAVTYTYEMPRPPRKHHVAVKKHGHPRRRLIFPYRQPVRPFPRYLRSRTSYRRGRRP